ncbi:CPBP family intramembrane metalloprotease [Geodermatophilus sp. TF02-6]|nr:CPBP family intramembrane metalloprotease [Geodermatophilus sp. TF02-6]
MAWSNLVVPALSLTPGVRTGANLAAAVALVAAARAGGLSWTELGLGRRTWRAGIRWGGAALAAITAGYGVLLAVPALRPLLVDPRVEGTAAGQLAVRALLLIPLGTVVPEEVAFRGVLLALTSRLLAPGRALALTSAVFGLWHLASARLPPVAEGFPLLGIASVAAVVAVTAAGGWVFGWLRQRSGSLLAPIGAHLGSNGLGLLAAWVATGRA